MRSKFHLWMRATATVAALVICGTSTASNGVVGPGNCNESGFSNVLAAVDSSGGGTITFNCGTATINISGHKEIVHAVTIDGGGAITFDGGSNTAFFQIYGSAHVRLRGLTLRHGTYAGGHNVLENFGILELDHVRVLDSASSEPTVINYGTLDVRWSTFGNNSVSSASADGGAMSVRRPSPTVPSPAITPGDTAVRSIAIRR